MSILQTIERPAGPRLAFSPAETGKNSWRTLIGIHKGMDTMEAYFKRHWAENSRELEQERLPEYWRNAQT
jgi:hypothetical protein